MWRYLLLLLVFCSGCGQATNAVSQPVDTLWFIRRAGPMGPYPVRVLTGGKKQLTEIPLVPGEVRIDPDGPSSDAIARDSVVTEAASNVRYVGLRYADKLYLGTIHSLVRRDPEHEKLSELVLRLSNPIPYVRGEEVSAVRKYFRHATDTVLLGDPYDSDRQGKTYATLKDAAKDFLIRNEFGIVLEGRANPAKIHIDGRKTLDKAEWRARLADGRIIYRFQAQDWQVPYSETWLAVDYDVTAAVVVPLPGNITVLNLEKIPGRVRMIDSLEAKKVIAP